MSHGFSALNPAFLRHHQPHEMEPKKQRRARSLENRADGNRGLVLAVPAMQQSAFRSPDLPDTASGSFQAVRPADPFEMLFAIRIVLKPLEEFPECFRAQILDGCFHACHTTFRGVLE